jgi:photosystem II stability/assembly factor-like uncharacterized protein
MAATPPPTNGDAPKAPENVHDSEKAPEVAGPPTPTPPPAGGAALPPLPLAYVGIIAVLLVVAAIGVGLAIGTVARPSPTPRPTPVRTVAVPTPTPVPTTDPQVFRQTLTGACATGQGLWVVTNGGGLLRYDGEHWTLIDGTLRTLDQASCDEGTLYAVGPVGAMLIIDDRLRQITSFDVTLADLIGVAAMPEGAMAVGTAGTVMFLSGGSWQEYARGLEEDLYGIVAFGPQSAWVVGSQGASYRLEAAGWRPVPTGVTVVLRSVSATGPQSAVAAGDAGTVLVFDGTWKPVETGVTTNLRAIARLGSMEWIVGDAGTVLILDAAGGDHTQPGIRPAKKFDLGTTCDLRSVFVNGQDVWIVGSTGSRGGVWRIRGDSVAERWGAC